MGVGLAKLLGIKTKPVLRLANIKETGCTKVGN